MLWNLRFDMVFYQEMVDYEWEVAVDVDGSYARNSKVNHFNYNYTYNGNRGKKRIGYLVGAPGNNALAFNFQRWGWFYNYAYVRPYETDGLARMQERKEVDDALILAKANGNHKDFYKAEIYKNVQFPRVMRPHGESAKLLRLAHSFWLALGYCNRAIQHNKNNALVVQLLQGLRSQLIQHKDQSYIMFAFHFATSKHTANHWSWTSAEHQLVQTSLVEQNLIPKSFDIVNNQYDDIHENYKALVNLINQITAGAGGSTNISAD
jgi:hypothetical protein